MERMEVKKIAITGGIGSGKSTVSAYIKEQGYPVFSCDEIYKEIITTPTYVNAIQKVFPNVIHNGEIDRKRLSEQVFTDEKKRLRLNAVAHPLIMQRLMEKMQACTSELIFAEVPLLFEGGYQNLFDQIIIVKRSVEQRIQSVCERDGLTREQAQMRMCAQIDYDGEQMHKLEQMSNVFILQNDKDVSHLKIATDTILNRLS